MSYDLYTSLLKMHDCFRPSDEGVRLSIDYSAPELTELVIHMDLQRLPVREIALPRLSA